MTKELVRKHLFSRIKDDIMESVIGMAVILFGGLFLAGLAWLAARDFAAWMIWISIVLLVLTPIGLILYALIMVRPIWQTRRRIRAGEFSIVQDTVTTITNESLGRHYAHDKEGGGDHWQEIYGDFLYFANHDRIGVLRRALRYTAEGDKAYLVVYDSQPDKPVMFYSTKFYKM